MPRGNGSHRRSRGRESGARRRRVSRRAPKRPSAWRRPLIGAAAAIPVGLGLAAALTLAGLPQDAGRDSGGQQAAVPDDALTPEDDFFPSTSPSVPPSPRPSDQADESAQTSAEITVEPSPSDSGSSGSDATEPSDGGSDDSGPGGRPDRGDWSPPDRPSGGSSLASAVVELVNDERSRAGCPDVRVDGRLTAAAQGHSEDMAARDYMDHVSPDGEGPADRAAEVGYPAWSGENVAAGYRTAEDVMNGWMNSDGHRANILNCDNRAIGVGEAERYWTQMFGRE
ncbi:CAP domain-containing protein [Marinactinospora rubrisoli]|uniref:CAP domain-containing protein n=1 Tax=Marinactinospora rubrisoli TaxID=2715399 RepID=A0ABW2KG89_9ACTN